MSVTLECSQCDFISDFEETSETNPRDCPQCSGVLFYAGTDSPYLRDGMFLNLKDGKLSINSFRLVDATATDIEDLMEAYRNESDEILTASS